MPWAVWGQVVTAVLTEVFGDRTSFASLDEKFLSGINSVVSLEDYKLTCSHLCFPSLKSGEYWQILFFRHPGCNLGPLAPFSPLSHSGIQDQSTPKVAVGTQSLDLSVELGKETLGAAAVGLKRHFWHPTLNPVASCLSCVHFPLECTQKLGKHNCRFCPWSRAVPTSGDITICVRIKGKLKLILGVQGDLWGLAFLP